MIHFHQLGTIDLRDGGGQKISAIQSQPKRVALLSYLCLAAADVPVRRDTVLGLLWPELDEERARNALSKGLHHLRHELGAEVILTPSVDEIQLDPALLWSDVRAFREALRDERVADALNLYRGDLLPGLFVSEAPAFEKWLEREGRTLRELAANAARVHAERLFAEHQVTDAVKLTRRAVELAQHDERMVRRLIVLLDGVGDRPGAIRTYEEFAALLEKEYGAIPAPETQAVIARIREDRSPAPVSPSLPPAAPPTDQLAASLADRYVIERQLGSGGSATVHLAIDRKLQRKVAIKVLRPSVAASLGTDRFLNEILIAAPLSHPHIVPLLDSGEAGGLLFYVMPWLTGESLRDRLTREGRLPVRDALAIAREIADALAYAHAHGVVHRDIKPENILLESGHAVVADFGIARAIGRAAVSRAGSPRAGSGTPAYVSPEQAIGEEVVDGRGDIYSLGCVLFEMLTGRPPFTGNSSQSVIEQHRSATPPDIDELRRDLPPGVGTTLATALAKDPASRYALADELARAIGTIEAATAVRGSDRRRAVAVGVAVVATLLLGGGTLAAWFNSGTLPPDRRPQVVLANVDAADDSLLGRVLTAALRVDLTGSGRYQLVPVERTRAVLQRMGLPRNAELDISRAKELAIREGIPLVASVTVRRKDGGYLLTGEVSDPDSREPRPIRITVDSEAVLIERLSELSHRLRVLAGDRERDLWFRPGLEKVTTSSLPALRLYAATVDRANELWALEAAVRMDSGFAMANRILSIRYLQARRFSDSRRAFAAAWRHRERLTPVERYLLDATGAALSGWTDTAAIRASNDAVLALDPQNWAGLLNRAGHELWHHDPPQAEPFIARALAIDSTRPGIWDAVFWSRLAAGDSAGAAAALENGARLSGTPAPFLHEWAIYGWRYGDYSRVEYYLDSLSRIPGIADSAREDYPIISSSVAFLRGRHREAEEQWARFGSRVLAGRGVQIISSTIFREAECMALAHRPPTEIRKVIAPRIAAIDLTAIEANERESARNYLAGAWAWAGGPANARALLSVERRPDSLLTPWVLHTRVLSEQLILVAEGKPEEVIARDRTLPHSPQLGILELPLAFAYDRIGEEDSVLAAGGRFFRRRTFIAIASDLGCAEQILRARMGEILEARGDLAGARRHYERFLSTWPTPEPEFRGQYNRVRQRLAALDLRTDRSR